MCVGGGGGAGGGEGGIRKNVINVSSAELARKAEKVKAYIQRKFRCFTCYFPRN